MDAIGLGEGVMVRGVVDREEDGILAISKGVVVGEAVGKGIGKGIVVSDIAVSGVVVIRVGDNYRDCDYAIVIC